MVLVATSCQYSCGLYLAARDEIPVPVNSIYQLAYITMGRHAIYLVSVIQFIAAFGLDIIYFIVFGDTSASLVKTLCYPNENNFLTSRACYVLLLAIIMVMPLLQKELKEISILSVILFGGIGLFLVLMVVELAENGSNLNPDSDYSVYYTVKVNLATISSLGIVLVAFGFQQNLFPIQASLADKSPESTLKSIGIGLTMSTTLYMTMGVLALYTFGSGVESSVLTNIDEETTVSSYIIRLSFMLILACHIPYIFFSGKESLLIMVDEFRRRSMSYALELTLQQAVMSEVHGGQPRLSQSKHEKMPYMDMDNWLYVILTLAIFGMTVLCAIAIPSVQVVFGFISAISVSAISFWLPGLFYILALKKYPKPAINRCRFFMSYFYIGLGVFLGVFLLSNEIISIITGEAGGE